MGLTEERKKKIQQEAEAGIAYADEVGIQRSDRDVDRLDLLTNLAEAERERDLALEGFNHADWKWHDSLSRIHELEEENIRLRDHTLEVR